MGRPQQTLAAAVSRSGVGLHSGACSTATLLPARAGDGRYFVLEGDDAMVAAEVGNVEPRSHLCTTLRRGDGGGPRVRTVEHLLSAMEALGVDNCRIEIPLLDGSAQEWVEAIQSTGLCAAEHTSGQKLEKLAPEILDPVYLRRDDSFVAAFPSSQIQITYGIDFSEVEKMRGVGLIKGGSLENAMVCSMTDGWLNPPLRFEDEPCRHKILDLIGDFSFLAQNGNQGFPIAHIVAYKYLLDDFSFDKKTLISISGLSNMMEAGHSLHTDFLRHLLEKFTVDEEKPAGQC
ncbi:hypothetical protein PR202_gb19086 [Eleusine coracana subsp. coracana]|uniref:UDP-3-O-acyl-N-acetylglucosamine deacetylase n=1 Tax=Eleusine coracana subsp. coracana TaxID=191504 RepID=A0AAV5F922_ELECO|nr:hypothetical protein PR202_gb19086 [Eleusine coracana subsp. coracana]